MGKRLRSTLQEKIAPRDYNITFSNDKGFVGKLDFNGPEMIFTGDAEESAKVFMDWLAKAFTGRLKVEREACAKLVDHILKKGGVKRWDTET